MQTLKVIIGAGEALELTGGWLSLEVEEPDAVFLVPMRQQGRKARG